MIGRGQTLAHHSPALWGLYAGVAAFAGMLVVTVAWNIWDQRDQLVDRTVRALHR